MKSERRHELQHNALADWLITTGKALQPYQNHVLLAVTLVLVIALGYVYWSRTSAASTAQAWDEITAGIDSNNTSALVGVIEKYPGTDAAHVGAVVAADLRLANACNLLFTNKATARQELSKAMDLYKLVREQSANLSLLQRATFGLARAKESTAEADSIKQAKQLYEEIIQKWPKGTYTAESKQRLADLNRADTKQMYDDFAKFDPKPAFSGEGASPGQLPSFDKGNLPEESPIDSSDIKKDADAKQPAAPADKNAEKSAAKPGEKTAPAKQDK